MITIRLTGSLADILKAETELAKVFEVVERSDFYRNRSRGQFGRLYLIVKPLMNEGSKPDER